ncbi:hypothetical protein, partial [Nocardia gipuzkoensis]|uniref:hypothetical protein n=1 Tax=Nocardia gipuzkoensis TaxID=2749991 RepID=UPI00237D765D
MRGRHRKGRDCDQADSAVLAGSAAAESPDSRGPGPATGFAQRVLAAQPLIPAWIAWLLEHAGEPLARLEYQMHYPLDHTATPTGAPT